MCMSVYGYVCMCTKRAGGTASGRSLVYQEKDPWFSPQKTTLLPKSYYDGSFIVSTVKDPSMLTESLPSAPPSHHTTVLSSRRALEIENVLPTYLLRCVSSHFPNQNINSMRTLLFSQTWNTWCFMYSVQHNDEHNNPLT